GAQEIVQKRHVELQHFDELDNPAVRDIEFAVEVECAWIAVAAVFSDLAIVDVARKLRSVLVLLILWLERADADAVLFAQDHALYPDILNNAGPIAVVLFEPLVVHEAAERIEFAGDRDTRLIFAAALIE